MQSLTEGLFKSFVMAVCFQCYRNQLSPWVPQGFASLDLERLSFKTTIRFAVFNLNFPCTFGEAWSLAQQSWHRLGAC